MYALDHLVSSSGQITLSLGKQALGIIGQRDDWVHNRKRVYQWLKGNQAEQVHAVYENGTLLRGASEIFGALRRFWLPVYSMPSDEIAESVRPYHGDPLLHSPDGGELKPAGASADDILAFVKKLDAQCSGGPDGWAAKEWKKMDKRTAENLARLFTLFSQECKWPEVLPLVHTVFIPKGGKKGIQDVSTLRPISLTCLAYRTWAWCTLNKMKKHVCGMVHSNQYGGVPGRNCADMYLRIQLELERVLTEVQPDQVEDPWRGLGYTEDSWKFFDTLQPRRCVQKFVEHGFPVADVKLWLAFYRQHKRRLRVGKAVDDCHIVPKRGLLQGCAWSLLAGNLIMAEWCKEIEETGAVPMGYVDDREAEAADSDTLQQAVDVSRTFNTKEGLRTVLEADKTYCWRCQNSSYDNSPAILWGETEMMFRESWVLLGTDVKACRKQAPEKSKNRRASAKTAIERISCLPLQHDERSIPLAAIATSRFAYGQEAQHFTSRELQVMRTYILRTIWSGRPRRCPEAVMALCTKGHLVDPEMALTYFGVLGIKRCMREPAFQRQWSQTWRAVSERQTQGIHGPVAEFQHKLLAIGWQCVDGHTIQTVGKTFSLLDVEKASLQHELREALRVTFLARASARRKDFQGAEQADCDTTRFLVLKLVDAPIRRHLTTLLTGAIFTQRVRYLAGSADSAECEFCHNGDENVEHVLWHCVHWQHIRSDLPCDCKHESWPPAMRLCGIYVPGAEGAPSTKEWPAVQATLSRIIEARAAQVRIKMDHKSKHGTKVGRSDVHPPAENDADCFNEDSGHVVTGSYASFPLFRRFVDERASDMGDAFLLEDFVPDFSTRSSSYFDWGPDTWNALCWYWRCVRFHTVADEEDKRGNATPWIAIALDAAITCGVNVFRRADGDASLQSLVNTVKGASKRIGQLRSCPMLASERCSSRRLRPLWAPAKTSALDCKVFLLHPHAVDSILEEWGKYCLQLELAGEESAVKDSHKLDWTPTITWIGSPVKRRRLRRKSAPISGPMPEPPGLGFIDPVYWKGKLTARMMERRVTSVIEYNDKALCEGRHIIAAAQLNARPSCAACRTRRRNGHWLRLAKQQCNATKEVREAECSTQRPLLEALLYAQKECLAGPVAKRIEYSKRCAAKAAARPLMPVDKVKTLKRKRRNKELARLGFVTNSQKREAMGVKDNISKGRLEGFAQAVEELNKRRGYHHFEETDGGANFQCTRCGKKRVRAVFSKWKDELCSGQAHVPSAGGSAAKQRQAQERLDLLNKRRGKHFFVFVEGGAKVQCSYCGVCRGRDVFARWRDNPCPAACR